MLKPECEMFLVAHTTLIGLSSRYFILEMCLNYMSDHPSDMGYHIGLM